MKSKKFDWCDYYHFANAFKDSEESVELRCGISRFYYSGFCNCRDFIINHKKFLDAESKKIMLSPTSDVHGETVRTLMEHKDLQPYGKKIGRELSELRKRRNKADYSSSEYDVKSEYKFTKARLKIVFDKLEKLERYYN